MFKKNILFYLSGGMLVIIAILLGYQYTKYKEDKNFQKDANKVQDFTKQIDSFITDDANIATGSSGYSLEEDIAGQLSGNLEDVSLDQLKKYYTQSILKGQENSQFFILEKIYEKTGNSQILYLLVDKALKVYDYADAYKYVQMIYKLKGGIDKIGFDVFFNTMFNSLSLDSEQLEKMKSVVQKYYDSKVISEQEYIFYNGLINIAGLDVDGLKSGVESWPDSQVKSNVKSAFGKYESYRDVPKYYIYGLLSYTFFRNGYFNLSQKLAEESLKFNSDYVLPNQVLAYSNFIMNKHDKAKEFFKKLLVADNNNEISYKFYLGVSQFWGGNYEDAIVFLSQIKNGEFYKDALRYTIMSYYDMKDYTNMIEKFNELSQNRPLSDSDYYVFFDIFFFKPWQELDDFSIWSRNKNLAKEYISDCVNDLKDISKYICVAGKGGSLIADGQDEQSLKYLLYTVKYMSKDFMFAKIGDIYKERGDINNAKKYYIKAVLYAQSQDSKDEVKRKLLETVLDKK